jgi:uncharacterized repeat protein (TIGR03803 family)
MTRRASLFLSFLLLILVLLVCTSPLSAATNEVVLHSFEPYLHGFPGFMVADAAGSLYGASNGGSYNSGLIYKLTPKAQGAWAQTILYNFTGGNDGHNPVSLYWDGSNFYGLTESGGKFSSGVFFELVPRANGTWSEQVLFDFPNENAGLINPGIARDAAGNFYATTSSWFGPAYGSLFQLTRATGGVWTENVLYDFTDGADGGAPYCTPLLDSAGNIYGTTQGGGTNGLGVVFEFSPSGQGKWTETVLYNFVDTTDGYYAQSLVFDQVGDLWGTTQNGGAPKCTASGGCGTVFELKPNSNGTWTKTTLHTFAQSEEDNFSAGPSNLVTDGLGNIYGAAAIGGSQNCGGGGCGIAFELSPRGEQWSVSLIYGFTGGKQGFAPGGIFTSGGAVYGAMERDIPGELASVFRLSLNGGEWKLTNLYDFLTTDAASPLSNLIQDASGNLYGTADFEGIYDIGAVYELTPNGSGGWKESVIYNFASGFDNSVNGVDPSGLTMDAAGNLYGTEAFSGAAEYGSVFELMPQPGGKWQEKDLVDFAGSLDHPMGGVVFDHAGNLYGTTSQGGSIGLGTIFELIPGANGQWKEKTIHSFTGYPNDGASPAAGLVMDGAGNFYGTTQKGGSSGNCTGGGGQALGCGTIFKLSLTGGSWQVQLLYSFQGSTIDGANPVAPLIFDAAGNLYGTTEQGGIKAGCNQASGPATCGTVFELLPNGSGWTEKILYEFTNAAGDGADPYAAVTFDRTGNLWGTTSSGGTFGDGTVFELTPESSGEWSEMVVHSFGAGLYDGKYPEGSLMLDSAGNLYGATAAGGQAWIGNRGWDSAGYGTVFEITP